jgi:alginate O-acetyltransferase complex protein AlgJ
MAELLDNRSYRIASIATFALLLGAPLLGHVAGVGSNLARIELRTPAPLPALPDGRDALAAFPSRVEAHLDDTFGFRSQLVTAHSLLHLVLGVSGSPRYLVSRDGWFFHRSTDRILDQARGVDRFTPAALESWVREMEARQRWLADRGIEFLIVIAPSKHLIYPERLPDWVNRVAPTRHEQLTERLARGSPLELLDLHEPLLRAKDGEPLYRRNDGHWTELGAFVAYRAIAEWIAARHPTVRVLSRDDFDLAWRTKSGGSVARGLNLVDFLHEEVPELALRGPSRVVAKETNNVGMGYGPRRVFVTKTDLVDAPKVMFFRDSFATPVARFLAETVREVVLVHHRQGTFRKQEIERFQPDIVIYEMVERGLIWPLHSD